MQRAGSTLSMDVISELFPFHVKIDCNLVVQGVGPALVKACPTLKVGNSLDQEFDIISPNITLAFATISQHNNTVFFLKHLSTDMTLKGEMCQISTEDGQFLIFLCSPVVQDLEGVSQLGLSLNDFAIHDSTVDLLVLLQTKNSTINDITRMAGRLTQEVKVRRKAEKALQEANEILEDRVDARTIELKKTNNKLQN